MQEEVSGKWTIRGSDSDNDHHQLQQQQQEEQQQQQQEEDDDITVVDILIPILATATAWIIAFWFANNKKLY
jgi:hypothetical protein